MKKTICVLLALCALLCAGCGSGGAAPSSDSVPMILDQSEYVLYQNIFYKDYAGQYLGKEVAKHGVFAVVSDAFNDRTRYYVWGYMDNTKCCDWQWEIVPAEGEELPAPGSLVNVKGVFAASDDALDGYWIEQAMIQTETSYTGPTAEIDMCVMSCTLERVQLLNILYRPDSFTGKEFAAYGRVADIGVLEDPYYNNSWHIPFSSGQASPAIGTLITLRGTIGSAELLDCTLSDRE